MEKKNIWIKKGKLTRKFLDCWLKRNSIKDCHISLFHQFNIKNKWAKVLKKDILAFIEKIENRENLYEVFNKKDLDFDLFSLKDLEIFYNEILKLSLEENKKNNYSLSYILFSCFKLGKIRPEKLNFLINTTVSKLLNHKENLYFDQNIGIRYYDFIFNLGKKILDEFFYQH